MPLTKIFISHAKPEDNDFVRWLGARLTGEGYAVWAELLASSGGSPFWANIETAIREHAVKFISVVSKSSVATDRRGFRSELSLADGRGRSLGDDKFVIPIRLDDVSLDDFPAQLHQLHHLDFSKNWGQGYLELLQTLEKQSVPKSSASDSGLFDDWRRMSENAANIVEVASERALTNLIKVVRPPSQVNIFSYQGDPNKFASAIKKIDVPHHQFYQLVITLADAEHLQARLSESFSVKLDSTYTLQEFLEGVKKDATRPKSTDAKNILTALLRANIERQLRSRGLAEFRGQQSAYFFPKDLLPANKVFYKSRRGNRTWKAVVGRSEKMKIYWHLAMKVNVVVSDEIVVRFKPYICWSEDGKNAVSDPKRTSAMRKRFCKSWWNPQWLGLQEAFVSFLADDKPTISIETGTSETFALDRELLAVDLVRRMPGDLLLAEEHEEPKEEEQEDDDDADGFDGDFLGEDEE